MAVLPAPMPMVKPVEAEPVDVVLAVEKVMVLPLTTSVEPSVIAVARSLEVVRRCRPAAWCRRSGQPWSHRC